MGRILPFGERNSCCGTFIQFLNTMFLGGPEDIPIDGEEYEKSKPRILGVVFFCTAAVVAHFFAQDVGGCIALGFLGGSLYYYYKKPTHLSITLALGMSLAVIFMSTFIWFSILITTQMQVWQADVITKFEFTVYLLDSAAGLIALYDLQQVFDSPTSGGPRSFLPSWSDYGAGNLALWSPFSGQGQRLGETD